MTKETIRLGATITVSAPQHSFYQQQGRYLGPAELPGMESHHRICFDGKVQLMQRSDFSIIDQ